ncbi:MAG: carbonic anhydrase family protein [Acidobacteriota bacterium]
MILRAAVITSLTCLLAAPPVGAGGKSRSRAQGAHAEHGHGHQGSHDHAQGDSHHRHGHQGGKHAWGYEGAAGPQNWGSLSHDYERCSWGTQQSPIDIKTRAAGRSSWVGPVRFAYRDGALEVLNNGHTIQVASEGSSYAVLGGRRYELVQFHFHSPSEHTVDGASFEMEAHFVHRDHQGQLAVVAVLLTRGAFNPALQVVWDHMPRHANERVAEPVGFNATSLLPPSREAWHFPGSLTTPPCSEGVSWYVLKEPVEVSRAQIAAFRRVMPPNARPVQPLHGRQVVTSSWQ